MTTLPAANAKCALDFFHQMSKEHSSENILFSPVNLISSLGLILLGSGGNTATELEKVLHWNELKESEKVRNKRYLTTQLRTSASPAKFQEKDKISSSPRRYPEQHAKSHDDRLHPLEPQCTRSVNSRRQGSGAQLTEPHEERRAGPQTPSGSPEASCPQEHTPVYGCEKPEGVHVAFSKILAELNKSNTNYFLSFANKLYGDNAVAFIQKFLFCALQLYLTEVGRTDFHNACEEARVLINLWVEVRSHGEIKDLLPEQSLDQLTQLLMVNTLYLRGPWEIPFKKELTKEAPFYTNEKASHTVQLMHTRGTYNTGTVHLSNIEVQILEIPYKNQEMSMFILLPRDESSESFLQLEDALSHIELLDWSRYVKPEDVEVAIPKFSMEKTTGIEEYLHLSQISDSEKADFSGAITSRGVALSQLVHDTFFEVDEEGVEEPSEMEDQGPKHQGSMHFVADHPFLFYVLHKSTKSIIVFGRFSTPE
ncbi:serpin B4-like [Paroedura picta]|uniref:serpin B4-like n=1 Tax=Paroedura picta TaxID=143630 RepID=UPI0040561C3E